MQEHIVTVGAGAVGGYIGGQLARQGVPVTLIDSWPEHVTAIRESGLELSGMTPEESHAVAVEALHVSDVQALSRRKPVDIAICAAKAYDTEWATALIKPYLAPTGFVVSAQNSINEERIAGIVGWGRTVGCVLSNNFGVDLYEPGRIRRTMPRSTEVASLFVGEIHGRITPRLERLRDLFSLIDGTKTTTNLWGERWSKLCHNGMRNGVSAASGMGGNARDNHPIIRKVLVRLAGEGIRVGKALGYDLGPVTGMDPELLLAAADGDRAALERVEARMIADSQGSARSDLQRPSMAQDIDKGRRTEIDFINGLIVRKGRELGYAVTTHERLIEVVKKVERGELAPAPENLFDL